MKPTIPPYADVIAKKIKEKYAELCESKGLGSGKEVAGFVITFGSAFESAHVVSLASGTKCISGGNISQNGIALHDCHAEVLAHRGLLQFFYHQLKLLLNESTVPQSIFELRPEKTGFKLKVK